MSNSERIEIAIEKIGSSIAKSLKITWGSFNSLFKSTKITSYENYISSFEDSSYDEAPTFYLGNFLSNNAYLTSFILALAGSGALATGYNTDEENTRKKYALYAAGGTSLALALNFLLAACKCINFYEVTQ